MQKNKLIFISFLTLMVIIIGGIWATLHFTSTEKVYKAQPLSAYEQDFNYDKQPFLGDANASVRIVEFGDFKCPACKQWKEQIFPQLERDFIKTGKVKLYFINFPFIGEDSYHAANVGEAVFHQNKDAFWEYYKLLYTNQQDEHKVWATPEYLVDLVAKKLPEIDVDKMLIDLQTETYHKDVESDYNIASKYRIPGTPAIYINGKPIDPEFDYNFIKKQINKELEKAEVKQP